MTDCLRKQQTKREPKTFTGNDHKKQAKKTYIEHESMLSKKKNPQKCYQRQKSIIKENTTEEKEGISIEKGRIYQKEGHVAQNLYAAHIKGLEYVQNPLAMRE